MSTGSPRRTVISRMVALLAIGGVVLAGLAAAPAAAVAAGTPQYLQLSKSVDKATPKPGETFTYSITVTCSEQDCVSAQLTDLFPAGLDGFAVENVQFTPTTTPYSITWTPSGTSTPPATIGTNTGVTVDLLQSIRNGAGQGLPAGQTVTLLVSLRVPDNYPPGQGPTIVNTATVTATNSSPASDSASIAVNAPVNIGVNVTKTWTPNTQAFAPGSASTIALGVGNGSNVKADKLVIQEPKTATDGASALDPSNPFTIMDFTGFANIAIPASCTTVQVDAYVFSGGTWSWRTGPPSQTLALPSGVQNGDVGGIRVTCVGTIPPGDTVSFGLGLAQRSTQRDTGADLSTASHTVNNVANGIATVGSQSATKDATASFTEAPSMPKVTTTKNIAPGQITAGQSAAASITAANGTVPVAELRISDLGFFTTDVAFGGFTAAPAWPAGASAAKAVYHLAAGGTQEVAFAQGATPAAPSGPITGFELVFTGSPIAASTTAGASFTIQTTENATGGKPSVTLTNTATSTVTTQNGLSAQASDTAGLKILNPDVAVSIQKALRPNTAVSPGDTLIAALQTKATATGDGAIMHDIVVEDAWDKSAGGFWNAFDLEAVAPTQVPANSTLTIEVRDPSGTWVTLAVAPAQAQAFVYELNAGATTAALAALSPALTPAQVEGIRFTFHSDTGFAAATAVTPNIAFQAQGTLRTGGSSTPGPNRPTSYTNAATAHVDGKTAGNRTLTADASTTAPGSIVTQQNPPGPGPDIRKTWNKQYIDAQSSEQASTNLIWHVSSGFSPVTITDPAGSEDTPKNTVFDAFDLVGVAAIPASSTPYSNGWYLKYDTVTDVQLYDSATHTWVSAPVPAGGWMSTSRAFVGYTLTPAEQATTTGVRLVVAETAADTTARQAARQPGAAFDPYAPAPGSGVGAGLGSGGTDRTFTLTWQLRDVTRSDGTPVTQTSALNGGAGVVDNTVGIAATPLAGGADVTGSDHDTIAIVNQGPGVVVKKTVTPSGPLYTPVVGTPASSYPTAQWSIVGHNDSTAKASAVRLTDPATCDQTSLPGCESDVSRAFDDPFDTSRDYLNSADAPNPFERFTATKVTIAASIPAQTDLSKATVWLLHYQPGTPGTYTTTTDTAANVNGYSESQLADVVGISVTFSGVSAQNTGLITQDNNLSILVDSRMRPTLRSSGANQVLPAGKTVDVLNRAFAQSYDPVLAPDGTPGANVGDVSDATITLTGGSVDIRPSKSISPSLIPEPAKADPVTVTLGATSGTGTLAPNKVVIEDYAKATDFWNTFDFAALGAVTMPAGADRVQVDAVVNGSWVLGAPAAAATLPQGIDPTTIQGLRFTFSRADGGLFSQTLPAASWNTSVSFTAHVRAADRTSGAPIVFDHTVDNTQTSQSTRVDGNDSPAVDAQADVTLSQGTHQLAVNKLTNGGNRQAAVGATVPFDLTFQNTGTGFLTVSQLTDALPAQLIPGDTAPVYTKQPGGSLSDQVSMSVAPDGRTITFTWPSGGNQMKPNEVFAIRLYLVLQPGLAQGATATNTMTVSTLEQLTNCRNIVSGGSTTGAWASDPKTCGTTDYVGAVAGPNLFTAKGVKGALPGAYRPDGSGLACVANLQATGGPYFRSPCVANSEVGGTDEWVLNNVNAGTVPVSQMTIFDQLPTPGDSFLITGGNRGSQFRPELVAGSLATDVPAGTTQTIEVTSSSNVCVGTWTNLVTQPVCEQSGEVWSVPDGSTDWTKVTGIRVTLDFTTTSAGALLSGQSANVTYSTLNALESASNPTGASASVPATDQIVWNQYGVKYLDASKPTAQKIAPNAVASHLRFGSIEVSKKVTGPAASYAPASFLADVVCTAGTVPLDLGAASTVELDAGNGYTARIDGIPLSAAGTSCTVTEQGSVGKFGETSRTGSPTTLQVTEAAPQDGSAAAVPAAQIATITNDYQFTGLSVTKKVDTQATTGSFGPFGFTLSCTTATGAPVLLDGTSTTLPFTIATAGGTWTAPADRIPVGSSCTLTEVDRSAADHTVIVGDNVVDQGSGVATITPGTTPAVVTVTNGYDAGTLTVAKQVTGTGAALYGTGSFDFTAVCTYRSQQLLDEAFSLRGGDTKTFGTFPAGTSCAVTEKTTGGATDASMSPAGGTVTIAAPTAPAPVSNVVVTATNRFDLASFDVIKSRLGNLLNPGAAGPFTVEAVCTYVVDGVVTPLTVPGGAERQLTADNAYRTSYADLPVGATCDVTETETQHAGSTTVTVDSGTPVTGTSGTVELLDAATVPQMTIANTFTAGTLSVTKTVSGTAASDHANDVFGVSLACTWYGTAIAIPGGAERDLTVATPVVYTDLPTDAQCVLTETRTGNANQVTVTSNHALLTAGDSVTIAADTTLGINVDNRFDKPLPATGVDGRTVTLVGALGLIAMLGGILLFLGRRRRRA